MRPHSSLVKNAALFTLGCIVLLSQSSILVQCGPDDAKEANLFQISDCLSIYMDSGNYSIKYLKGEKMDSVGSFDSYRLLTGESKCVNGTEAGVAKLDLHISDMYNSKLTLEIFFKNYSAQGYWEISSTFAQFTPVEEKNGYSNRTELIPIDVWAGDSFSFSCSKLELNNLIAKDGEPEISITLRRFQMQLSTAPLFAPSYDCAVWFSLPMFIGIFFLILFTFTIMILVYLMVELGNQTCDLKFCKQAGMLMNQSQLENTKG